MINLLSPNDQRQLAAARTNTLILRYVLLASIVIVFMALEMLGVYLLLSNDMRNSQSLIDSNNEKASAYKTVQVEAATFRSDLAISKYILDKQVPYTSIIFAIAQALPSTQLEKATIDNLSLVPSTFGTPVVLAIRTDSTQTAIDVKSRLQQVTYNGKNIFTSVSFDSITAPDADSDTTTYLATYKVTYSKEITSQ